MNLDDKWDWERKKLACRVRVESGNPGADELRERICELVGMDYETFQRHFLADKQHAIEKSLATKEDKAKPDKGTTQAAHDTSTLSRGVQSVLRRININLSLYHQSDAVHPSIASGSGNISLLPPGNDPSADISTSGGQRLRQVSDEAHAMPVHRRNINKKFIEVAKSPPRRALFDLKMERLTMAVESVSMDKRIDTETAFPGDLEEDVEGRIRLKADQQLHDDSSSAGHSSASADNWGSAKRRKGKKRSLKPSKPHVEDYHSDDEEVVPHRHNSNRDTLFKPYSGDMFGTSCSNENGMIYLSRMVHSEALRDKLESIGILPPPIIEEVQPEEQAQDMSIPPKLFDTLRNEKAGDSVGESSMESGVDGLKTLMSTVRMGMMGDMPAALAVERKSLRASMAGTMRDVQAKLHCAQTLSIWSKVEANTYRLYKEGAVQAIIRLSKETDRGIQRCCASAFRHMSTQPLLSEQLVNSGAVAVMAEMMGAHTMSSRQLTTDCTVALVNLTRHVGTEAKLVEDGIVLALMSLPNDSEEWDELCARGLFNLTCVDSSYPFLERVIKAFMSLATSNFISIKYITASALCNVADMKQVRLRMIEEGVVQALSILVRGADSKTRRLCAIVLHSLAANRNVRAELASRGAIQIIYNLSSDNDMTTLYCVASGILRLATEDSNASRLVSEGGISAIRNVAIRCTEIVSTSQACAAVLHHLSSRAEQRASIVQEGCIPALITMLRSSTDYLTLHYSVLAICNLLTLEDNQRHIQQQGGVQIIVQLCRHEHVGIQKSCAFAIFTLSCEETARRQAAAAGAIPVIIGMSQIPDDELRMYCAATLCMLSTDNEHTQTMVKNGVIQTFIDLLQTSDKNTIRYSCAALCSLAYNNASCMDVIEQGAVPHVVEGALHSDENTQQSCCAVLSALSTHSECRQKLCDFHVLPALVSLARSVSDEVTRLRCAVAFANLSCESAAQGLMVQAGVVKIVSDLSVSYSEENQTYCAKALCNLACHTGSEVAIIDQGGLTALMMIGMVRAVSHQTKQICAKAILNLINPDTITRIAEDGLVTACSSLSKLDDEDTMKATAQIFLAVSLNPNARIRLVGKVGALHALFNLSRSPDLLTRALVGGVVCNLLSFTDSREMTVLEGGLAVIKEFAGCGEETQEIHVTETLMRICDNPICRLKILETQLVPLILLLARKKNAALRTLCLRILTILAWHLDTRPFLVQSDGIASLSDIIGRLPTNEPKLAARQTAVDLISRALFYLSLELSSQAPLANIASSLLFNLLSIQSNSELLPPTNTYLALLLHQLSMIITNPDSNLTQNVLALLSPILPALSPNADLLVFPASTLYHLAIQSDLHSHLLTPTMLDILRQLYAHPSCYPTLAAIFFLLSLDSNSRLPMAQSFIAEALCCLLDVGLKYQRSQGRPQPTSRHVAGTDTRTGSEDEDTDAQEEAGCIIAQNTCAALFMICKNQDCRARMEQAGVIPLLVKLSKSGNLKITDLASQALNYLSETSCGGIEEGTVAALIAIAFEGSEATQQEAKAEDYLAVPALPIVDSEAYAPHDELRSLPPFVGLAMHPQKVLAGPGGKGPKPPRPPTTLSNDMRKALVLGGSMRQELSMDALAAEEDGGADAAVDKIMLFAKMDLPPRFIEEDERLRALEQQAEKEKQHHVSQPQQPPQQQQQQQQSAPPKSPPVSQPLSEITVRTDGRVAPTATGAGDLPARVVKRPAPVSPSSASISSKALRIPIPAEKVTVGQKQRKDLHEQIESEKKRAEVVGSGQQLNLGQKAQKLGLWS